MQEFKERAEKSFMPKEPWLSRLFPTPLLLDVAWIRRSSEQDLELLKQRGFLHEPLDAALRAFLDTPSERPPIYLWIFSPRDDGRSGLYLDLSPLAVLPVERFGKHRMLYCGRLIASDKVNLAARARHHICSKVPVEQSLRWIVSDEERPIGLRCEACRGSGKYRRGKSRGLCRLCSGSGRRLCKIRRDEGTPWLGLPEHLRGKFPPIYLEGKKVRRGTPRVIKDAIAALMSETADNSRDSELANAEEQFNQTLQQMREFVELEQSLSIGESQTLRISNPREISRSGRHRLIEFETHGSTALWEDANRAYLLESADSKPRKVKIELCAENSIRLEMPEVGSIPAEAHLVSQRDTRPFDVQRWSLRWWMRESAGKSPVKRALCAPEKLAKFQPETLNKCFNERIFKNTAQRRAVELALSNTAAISCIQGPPGTGKTSVIVEVVRQHLARGGGPVLIASQSNLAVDNVLERLIDLPETVCVRLGREERVLPSVVPILLDDRAAAFAAAAEKQSKVVLERLILAQDLLRKLTGPEGLISKIQDFEQLEGPRHSEQLNKLNEMLLSTIDKISGSGARLDDLPQDEQIELGQIADWAASQLALIERRIPAIKHWRGLVEQAQLKPTKFLRPFINVIGATCIGSDHSFLGRHFDKEEQFLCEPPFELVVLDEVGRSSPMESLVPMQLGQRVVLVGDHKQLPPVISQEVMSAWEEVSNETTEAPGEISLFEVLIQKLPPSYKAVLQTQFRMHPQIADFIAAVFYQEEQLKSGIKNDDRELPLQGFPQALSYHSTKSFGSERFDRQPSGSTSRFNEAESEVVLQLLTHLDNEVREPLTVGAISFYSAQSQRISDALGNLNLRHVTADASTLDAYQGQERDIIILSLVRCPADTESFNAQWYRFFLDVRRLNVALSRARRRLMIVGDIEQILKISTDRGEVPGFEVMEQLFSYIRRHKLEVPLNTIYDT